MHQKLRQRIEEVILIIIILLNILDFIEYLPGDLDFIKKMISWVALGYLLYKASLTSIFFANKHIHLDLAIIISYFILIFKDLVAYTSVAAEEAAIFSGFFSFILINKISLEYYSFYIGGILLILLAFYMALKIEIKKPSLMHVIHEEGKPVKRIDKLAVRFLAILLVLVAFFIVVFNLVMEWLAIAIDAPILMIAIFFYLFIIIRHYAKFKAETLIFKIGAVGENFYKHFIKLFHYKKTLFLAIIGILVLHLLTDVGNFIVPYVFGFKDILYFKQLGLEAYHIPVVYLLIKDFLSADIITKIALFLLYFFNIIAMLFLLLMPTFVWYRLSKQKELHVSRNVLALIFSSLTIFLLTPAFAIKRISALTGLVGVDILTKSILEFNSVIRITVVAILSLIAFLFIFFISLNKELRKDLFLVAIGTGLIFFSLYIFYYFMSIYLYYISTIRLLFSSSQYFICFYFILFAMIAVLFYLGGFVLFIYEIWKNSSFYKRLKLKR